MYSHSQILLHDLVLGRKFINQSLFQLDKLIFLDSTYDSTLHKHIFITGLARSGTTALLYFLFKSKDLCSLTYANMPFVLSPNLFKNIKNLDYREAKRFHNDGIMFNNNSPEAFDEVFFKTFSKNEEYLEEYSNFINLVVTRYQKKRYLSKNNNNYKRIKFLSQKFHDSHILICIRDPFDHSISLLNQHKNFLNLQRNNNFIRRYMNYLGHNEFGIDHKSWSNPKDFHSFDDINYWLEQWYFFYKQIKDYYINLCNIKIVPYKKLSDVLFMKRLCNDIEIDYIDFNFKIKKYSDNLFDKNLSKKCNDLYEYFINR